MSDYDNIPMTQKSMEGMSWTPEDQQFLKRCFDRQDANIKSFISETYDEHAKIICGVVREMIAEQNSAIFEKIDEQNKVIKEIQRLITTQQKELSDHEKRIKILEKKLSDLLIEHNGHHK